jgi:hypothetical protein
MKGVDGILGFGPSNSSEIVKRIPELNPNPFIYRALAQNISAPRYISFFFSRTETANATAEDTRSLPLSQLTIGEVIPGFEQILIYPQIPVQRPPNPNTPQRWNIEVEAIMGPGDVMLNLTTAVQGASKLIARLDTGYSFSQLPKIATDAIYSNITGAEFDPVNFWWTVPCKTEINVTFMIQGFNYIIHPLDVSLLASGPGGRTVCIGTVSYPLINSSP